MSTSSSLQEIVGCLGHPIAGNPTQFIFERAFAEAGVDARCLTLDVPPDRLAAAVEGMRAMGFRGTAIAAPHHVAVCSLVDSLTETSSQLQFVDFLFRDEQRGLVGGHTLGEAVVTAMGRELSRESVTISGTGREACAIALCCATSGATDLTVAGTNSAEGTQIVELVNQHAGIDVCFERTSHNVEFEPDSTIVIKTDVTDPPSDRASEPLPLVTRLGKNTLVVDLPYRNPHTEFLTLAADAGCQVIDGVDVLVHRAGIAFRVWTGHEASAAAMRDAVEEFFLI